MKASPCAASRKLLRQNNPPLSIARVFAGLSAKLANAHKFVAHGAENAPISVAMRVSWRPLSWRPHFSADVFSAYRPVELGRRRSFARYDIATRQFAYLYSAGGCRHSDSILSGHSISSDNKSNCCGNLVAGDSGCPRFELRTVGFGPLPALHAGARPARRRADAVSSRYELSPRRTRPAPRFSQLSVELAKASPTPTQRFTDE
jgi:hypothetical protein